MWRQVGIRRVVHAFLNQARGGERRNLCTFWVNTPLATGSLGTFSVGFCANVLLSQVPSLPIPDFVGHTCLLSFSPWAQWAVALLQFQFQWACSVFNSSCVVINLVTKWEVFSFWISATKFSLSSLNDVSPINQRAGRNNRDFHEIDPSGVPPLPKPKQRLLSTSVKRSQMKFRMWIQT